MTPEQGRSAVVERLRGAGFEIAATRLGAREVTVARLSVFRWRWIAVRMHMFVFLDCLGPDDDPATLDELLAAGQQYSIENKGGLPRGLQTGSMAIPVVFGADISSGIVDWAQKPHGRKFAAMAWTVAANTTSGTVYQPKRAMIGAVFVPYMRRLVRDNVTAALAPSST